MKDFLKHAYKYLIIIIVALLVVIAVRNLLSSTKTNEGVNVAGTPNLTTTISGSDTNKKNSFEKATVVRVVDGDTVVVNISNKEKKVRMIGVDTPESVHPDKSKNTDDGILASEYTKNQLTKGKIIYLEYDKDLYDDYGRLLAYIWLTDNVNTKSINDISKYMYNAILLENGYADILTISPNDKYQNYFQLIRFGGDIRQ